MAPAIAPQVTQLWILIASSYKRTLLWVSQIMSCLTTINTFIQRRLKELWLHKYTITAIFQLNNNNVTRRTLCNYFPHILLFISDCPALDHRIEERKFFNWFELNKSAIHSSLLMLLQIISSSSGDPVFHFKIPQLYPASVYDYYFTHSLSIEPVSTKHVHPMPTIAMI